MKLIDFSVSNEKKRGVHEPELTRSIRLLVPAQGATISPPLGPTLGQFGINIKDFCDKFNEKSKFFETDVILNVVVNLFRNKSFDFKIKFPSIAFMINEEEVDLENEYVNKYLSLSSIYKIISIKNKDLLFPNKSLFFCILGTARSMDLKIVNDLF